MANMNSVLKEVLKNIEPSKEEAKLIENSLENFKKIIQKNLKKQKIKAEIFVGGSFAKETVIKRDKYDVDLFVRFDKKHKELSEITKKLLKGVKNTKSVHGSRDYFQTRIKPNFFIEIIPVRKIKNPKDRNSKGQ